MMMLFLSICWYTLGEGLPFRSSPLTSLLCTVVHKHQQRHTFEQQLSIMLKLFRLGHSREVQTRGDVSNTALQESKEELFTP